MRNNEFRAESDLVSQSLLCVVVRIGIMRRRTENQGLRAESRGYMEEGMEKGENGKEERGGRRNTSYRLIMQDEF